jgi:hypothetical protein
MDTLTKWLKITNQFNNSNNDEKPTHLLLNGYKLYVKNENIKIFNKKYAESILNGDKHYIVECRKDIFKLFFDLDFLLSNEQYEYSNTENIFIEIIKIINDTIYEFYEEYYECCVTTAAIKKVKKLCKDNENPDNFDSKEFIKKGFHLHYPDINVNKNLALEIRKACIIKLQKYKTSFENSINDIVDEHVYLNSGLRLTGSRKGHFISQTKEFVDEGRPYNLLYVLTLNNIDDVLFNKYKNDINVLIDKTSIITEEQSVTNIKNNPNLNCEDCEEEDSTTDNFSLSAWNRLPKDDTRHIEILRFFNIYIKDYTIKDIKRIFYSENESVYILCSQSKYCTNIGRNHNSEHIYFKLNKDGICQKCFCKCDTLDGRKYGYCKDYSSTVIPCTPLLRRMLNFKEIKDDKHMIKKNNKLNDDVNVNSLFENIRCDLFNQFTNKEKLPSKRKVKKS